MNLWDTHLQNSMREILFTEEQIDQRIKELAEKINKDYAFLQDDLIVIGVLRGSVLFMSDLLKNLKIPVVIDFMAAGSYGRGTESSGKVHISKDISFDITGRHVLIIEDIVDTGLTLANVLALLQLRNPASLKLCSLLNKPSRRCTEVCISYCGFDIPDVFVVGYGLDFDNKYRHVPYIGVLKPEMYTYNG